MGLILYGIFCKKMSGSHPDSSMELVSGVQFCHQAPGGLCVVLCTVLFLCALFLTYKSEIIGHTQSMTLLTFILYHLQDFRDRTRSVGFEI